jgi:hypothetical protein
MILKQPELGVRANGIVAWHVIAPHLYAPLSRGCECFDDDITEFQHSVYLVRQMSSILT